MNFKQVFLRVTTGQHHHVGRHQQAVQEHEDHRKGCIRPAQFDQNMGKVNEGGGGKQGNDEKGELPLADHGFLH
ncbi:hypothetical protein D3C73_1631790 [compost metagenome]